MNTLYILDLIGTFVFAISGIRLAAKKDLDLFGAAVIGFVTAVGGGTVRDVILGSFPVGWVNDLLYPLAVLVAIPVTLIFKKHLIQLTRTLFIFDTIGIAIFTILGLQKSLSLGIHPAMSIVMGMVSAVVGGVIRDILCNEIPLILRREIYATACLIGALVFTVLENTPIPQEANVIITVIAIVIIRVLSIKYKWSLPRIK